MMYRVKTFILCSVLYVLCIFFTGCSFELVNSFPVEDALKINTDSAAVLHPVSGFAEDLAVIDPESGNVGDFDALGIGTALLVDDDNHEIIVSYGGNQQIYPASMTKVMSGILIAEALEAGTIHMEDQITLQHNIVLESGAAKLDISMGDRISVQNLVYGYLIRSLNDCGIVLAETIAGSEEAFVEMMNDKAVSLGATHTHFVNCHGLHDEKHYTTAYDLYLFFREFAAHDLIHQIDQITSYTLSYVDAEGETVSLDIESTNGFLSGAYDWSPQYRIGAWKSGTTKAAGYCLIMQIVYQDRNYYAVICKAEDRDTLYDRMRALVECIPDS